MELRERVLYHQIHPAKLVTDFGTAMLAAVLLWRHQLLLAAAVGLVPSVVVSFLLVHFANLERLRDSPLGRYIARFITRAMDALRFLGVGVFWAGSWMHRPLLATCGFLLILAVWARGKLWPDRSE